MIKTTFATDYFTKWLFNQSEAWLSTDGEWFVLAKGHANSMHPHHTLNTLLKLERIAMQVYKSRYGYEPQDPAVASKWLTNTPLYKALKSYITSHIRD